MLRHTPGVKWSVCVFDVLYFVTELQLSAATWETLVIDFGAMPDENPVAVKPVMQDLCYWRKIVVVVYPRANPYLTNRVVER